MKLRAPMFAALIVATLAIPAFAAHYKVDPVHSALMFRVKHMNTSYAYGRFNAISGTFAIDSADPAKSSFNFLIKADSVDTGNAGRDKHLTGPDFFNAKQFPMIGFKTKTIAAARSGTDSYEVTGDLTLHGVTKPITVVVVMTGTGKDMTGKAIAGIETRFTIKRSDFGMKGMMAAVGDEVQIALASEGVLSK